MFCVVWDYWSSKLKDKQYKQKTSPKYFKTEVKILANPRPCGFHITPDREVKYVHCKPDIEYFLRMYDLQLNLCSRNGVQIRRVRGTIKLLLRAYRKQLS